MELSGGAAGGAAGAGGGNADAMFNQGVILWNAGKVADAKKQFEGAVAANPSHAEAHYQLGMCLVNEGTPQSLSAAANEFETYLKLAPTGPNAATAKGILTSLPKK
jgi:lipoprotein NlpI